LPNVHRKKWEANIGVLTTRNIPRNPHNQKDRLTRHASAVKSVVGFAGNNAMEVEFHLSGNHPS